MYRDFGFRIRRVRLAVSEPNPLECVFGCSVGRARSEISFRCFHVGAVGDEQEANTSEREIIE